MNGCCVLKAWRALDLRPNLQGVVREKHRSGRDELPQGQRFLFIYGRSIQECCAVEIPHRRVVNKESKDSDDYEVR